MPLPGPSIFKAPHHHWELTFTNENVEAVLGQSQTLGVDIAILKTMLLMAIPLLPEEKAGADAEAMEGCSLLACLLWLAQPALL
jgi:hypothetical protein